MSEQAQTTSGTRDRILDAAGPVFAEKGFRDATIREIVRRAGVNLNAVNYHFGDKEGLYRAVFEYAHHCFRENGEAPTLHDGNLSAEQRLKAFVRFHLQRMRTDSNPAWFGQLRMREMVEPTGILDTLIEVHIRPHHEFLVGVVRELIGDEASEELVGLCTISIVGQCLHYHHGRPVITRLHPEFTYDAEGIDKLVEHVTRFSLAAIKGLSGKKDS